MTIHGDARSGTLRKDTLVRYLGADPKALSALDPVTGLPPLATAAVAGFPDVVELLLSNGAPVDGLSRDGETALLLTMKEGTRNRALIVQLLLKKKPAVDATSAASGNNTALMYATTKEDLESMRLLVAAGASPTKINNAGLSATQMANETKKGRLTLKGQKEETGVLASLASAVLAVAKYVVSFAQKTTGAVMRFFGWSPKTDKTLDEKINDGETPNDEVFLENVDDHVQRTPSLRRFFKDKHDYIQELAKKAVALKNDKSTSLGEPEVLPKTIKQVIYCDDSSSMKRDGRWAAQADLVARIARVTTQILPDGDGVALRFINQSADQSEKLSFQQLQSTMNSMSWQPNGDTPIGTNLRSKILEPMVYSKLQPATLRRPLLVSVITDGMPSQESNDTLVEVIKECGAKLTAAGYPRDSVKFVVGQIGTAKSAAKFLEGVGQNAEIRDMVFVTAEKLDDKFRSLQDNGRDLDRWLIELLFAPIMNRAG